MVTLYQTRDLIRQRAFRVILESVSRPGRIFQLPEAMRDQGRFTYLCMILETLLDQEATHCMINEAGSMQLERWTCETTRSPCVALEEADFIIAPHGSTAGKISCAKRGQPEYPDMSAMVVYNVGMLSAEKESSAVCSLLGPGIAEGSSFPAVDGFDRRELLHLCTINREFPLGVDALFVDPAGRMFAVPRSTQIHIEDPKWRTRQ